MATNYINVNTLRKLIRETNGQPYWMQKIVFKLYWGYQKNGETFWTLEDCWDLIKRSFARLYDVEESLQMRHNKMMEIAITQPRIKTMQDLLRYKYKECR